MKHLLLIFLSGLVLSACGNSSRVVTTEAARILATPTPPCMQTQVDADTVKVGDEVTIIGNAWQIGQPSFSLLVRENGAKQFSYLAQIPPDDYSRVYSNLDSSKILDFISAKVSGSAEVIFVVLTKSPGRVEVATEANGENYCSFPGVGSYTAAERSESITLTVVP